MTIYHTHWKRVSVVYGPPHDRKQTEVEFRGTPPETELTPDLARHAATIAGVRTAKVSDPHSSFYISNGSAKSA